MTYFIKYLLDVTNDYIICYQNLEHLEQEAKNRGHVPKEAELNYMKRTLISYDGPFIYSDFLKMAKVETSKQGALKVLNKFVSYGFLVESETMSKSKLFDINRNSVPYAPKNFDKKA